MDFNTEHIVLERHSERALEELKRALAVLCSAALLLSNSAALLSSSNAFTECAQDEITKRRRKIIEMRGANGIGCMRR